MVIPSPAADFAGPSLGESREKANEPAPTINTAPLADAEPDAVPANAVDYAYNDPDAGSVIFEEKTTVRKMVTKVEEVVEEEDGEAEEIEEEPGKEEVFANTASFLSKFLR